MKLFKDYTKELIHFYLKIQLYHPMIHYDLVGTCYKNEY